MKILALALMFVASVAIAAEQTAFGIAGDPAKVTRTITIDMSDDMRYAPAALDVKLGETVRFVVANKGATMHELILGHEARHRQARADDEARATGRLARATHGARARRRPRWFTWKRARRGEIVWRFNRAGTLEYACLRPRPLRGRDEGHDFRERSVGRA